MSFQKLAKELGKLEKTANAEFELRYLAKKAANKFTRDKIALNQSIKQLAKEAQLNDEQTKRVCEFANNDVYQQIFDSSDDKHVHFDIADPHQIVGSQEKTASTIEHNYDYDYSPRQHKQKIEKVANIELDMRGDVFSHIDPREDLFELQERYKYIKQELQDKVAMTEFKLPQLYNQIKTAALEILNTHPYFSLAQVVTESTKTAELLDQLTEDLVKEDKIKEEDFYKIVKTAQVNKEHSFVKLCSKYEEEQFNLKVAKETLQEVEQSLSRIKELF